MKERDNTSRSRVAMFTPKKRKDPVGKENRKRMKDSLKVTNIYTGGGDDCA
jgi:hypothetical protein